MTTLHMPARFYYAEIDGTEVRMREVEITRPVSGQAFVLDSHGAVTLDNEARKVSPHLLVADANETDFPQLKLRAMARLLENHVLDVEAAEEDLEDARERCENVKAVLRDELASYTRQHGPSDDVVELGRRAAPARTRGDQERQEPADEEILEASAGDAEGDASLRQVVQTAYEYACGYGGSGEPDPQGDSWDQIICAATRVTLELQRATRATPAYDASSALPCRIAALLEKDRPRPAPAPPFAPTPTGRVDGGG